MNTPHADTQEQLHIHKLQMRFSTPAFLILYGSASVSYCQAQQLFTATSDVSYSGQEQACADKGLRLCTLKELCPSRPDDYTSPFDQAFTFTPNVELSNDIASNSRWSAYKTIDGDGANCSSEGGCNGNSWVMIGKCNGCGIRTFTCNTHCEFVEQESGSVNGICPSWGSTAGHPAARNYLCCEGSISTSEVS